VGDKPLPEARQAVDHRDDLLDHRAASKSELPCKNEKKKNTQQTVI
jgi:hypothetical protein